MRKKRINPRSTNNSGFDRLLIILYFALLTVNSSAQNLDNLSLTLRSGSAEQKREVLFQIKNLKTEQFSRIAVSALNDTDAMVRATAASAVVFLPSVEAAAVLIPLLNDRDEFVRKETAYSLGKIRINTATIALIRVLNKEKDIEVKGSIIVALGEIGDVSAVEKLVNLLNDRPKEETEFLRRSAARSIGQIAQITRTMDGYVVTPQHFLTEKIIKNPNISEISVFDTAVTKLTQILSSKKEADDTRRESAFALGAIGNPSAINALKANQTSTDPYLVEITKEALLKISYKAF